MIYYKKCENARIVVAGVLVKAKHVEGRIISVRSYKKNYKIIFSDFLITAKSTSKILLNYYGKLVTSVLCIK